MPELTDSEPDPMQWNALKHGAEPGCTCDAWKTKSPKLHATDRSLIH
jgi:hypothetical protein